MRRLFGKSAAGVRTLGRWLVKPLVLALVLVLIGGALYGLRMRAEDDPALANKALLDTAATDLVVGDVSSALSRVFTVSPVSLRATEQAAAELLSGNAASQYTALFAQVKQRAAAQGLTVTTRVVRAGVVRLQGDSARLLVFLDQTIDRKDLKTPSAAAAQLSVTARQSGGHWRIVDIHAR